MEFGFSKELDLLREMYKKFAETEVKPLAEELDEEERFPVENIPKLARYGFMGIPFPKEYGGAAFFNCKMRSPKSVSTIIMPCSSKN
ncbi:MAG: acyl-CoA dehydrogenase family protein [Anaerotignum sp.]|nr:acyl-CoA dehydrogenase family protein [Anaerotignum sp.]